VPEESEYANGRKAALGLRRLLREDPETLLVAVGEPIFSGAYAVLYHTLYARAGAEIHRINLGELEFRDERAEHVQQPERYHCFDAEVGFVIGARKLGYRVSTLPPGHYFCPLHGHAREEEMFFVLDGEPSIRTLAGTVRCRKGDFIAFPVGESGAHRLSTRAMRRRRCYSWGAPKRSKPAIIPIRINCSSIWRRRSRAIAARFFYARCRNWIISMVRNKVEKRDAVEQ
jgi:uncharacterized cupin superfamily protein